LIIAWVLQIPWFYSPFIAYDFNEGLQLLIGFVNNGVSNGFSGAFRFGSEWHFSFNKIDPDHPWGIGINLFAVVILICLLKFKRSNSIAEK
jgi:hypothetical protein